MSLIDFDRSAAQVAGSRAALLHAAAAAALRPSRASAGLVPRSHR